MPQKTVLIIEDSAYLADSLVDMLHIYNHNSLVALTGREGVTTALTEHPDLILLDIRLPDIDGYSVYNQIRADDEWGANANIVVLTASESVENISKNIDLPPERVLFKPEWSVQALMEHLQTFL